VQETYDLKERGLAWQKNIAEMPEFIEVRREVRARFVTL
jgi:hypothetical protein